MKELWLQTRANNVIKPVCGWELTKLHIAESLQSTHYNIAPRDFFHPSNFSTQMPFRKQKNLFVGTVAIFFFLILDHFDILRIKKKKKVLCFVLSSLSTPLSSSSVFHTLARSLASSFQPHSSLMKNAFPRCAHKGVTWDSLKALLVLPACKKRSHLLHHLFFISRSLKTFFCGQSGLLPILPVSLLHHCSFSSDLQRLF